MIASTRRAFAFVTGISSLCISYALAVRSCADLNRLRRPSMAEDPDAHRRRSGQSLGQSALRVRPRALLRHERPRHHRVARPRPRHHEEPRLPRRHRAGRRRHDHHLPLARVLRLLQAVRPRSEKARHESLDRRRHRLSRRDSREASSQPSGAKHDLSMQALSLGQRFPVKAGETLNQAVNANAIAAVATSASGDRITVPITNGNINWTAPAGSDYTVAVVEHVFRTSPTKSDTNPTHAKDSTQPLEDYLNPEATAAYIEATHNGYYKAMPELFGTTILGFRGDEPDYSIAGLPWTPAFFDTFQKAKGYDIRPYLGAILLSQGGGRPRPPATPPASGAPNFRSGLHPGRPAHPADQTDRQRTPRQGRLLRRLLPDVPRRLLQTPGHLVRRARRRLPGPPEPRRDGDGPHPLRRRLHPRHEVRRSPRHRRHLAPDLDRHRLRLPAPRLLCRPHLRSSAVLHGELRRLPPRARYHHGALHPQRAVSPRNQHHGDDVLLRHAPHLRRA